MVLLQLCWSRNETQRTMNIFVMTAESGLIIFIPLSHSLINIISVVMQLLLLSLLLLLLLL